MAQFNKETDMHIVNIAMSDYQLGIYENAREGERKLEMEQAKRKGRRKKARQAGGENVYEDSTSNIPYFFPVLFAISFFPARLSAHYHKIMMMIFKLLLKPI